MDRETELRLQEMEQRLQQQTKALVRAHERIRRLEKKLEMKNDEPKKHYRLLELPTNVRKVDLNETSKRINN